MSLTNDQWVMILNLISGFIVIATATLQIDPTLKPWLLAATAAIDLVLTVVFGVKKPIATARAEGRSEAMASIKKS